MGRMSARRKTSFRDIERRLIADAQKPDAWEFLTSVGPSQSPRPSWYPKSVAGPAGRPYERSHRRRQEDKDSQFSAAYQKHYARVVRFYLQTFHLSSEEAEQLAHDAFARFYKALDEYSGKAEWAFLETVVRNVAYNRIRAQKTAGRTAQIIRLDDVRAKRKVSNHADVEDYAAREADALRRKQLHDAIAELPETQRQAVQLWLDGFQYSEISRVLGITLDAVKSRLRDAKGHLRASFEDSHDDLATRSSHAGGGKRR